MNLFDSDYDFIKVLGMIFSCGAILAGVLLYAQLHQPNYVNLTKDEALILYSQWQGMNNTANQLYLKYGLSNEVYELRPNEGRFVKIEQTESTPDLVLKDKEEGE
tara:strand:- start:1072 stop:1386 length:315 start_codon:yes stop_codon:yes gene_type:complete